MSEKIIQLPVGSPDTSSITFIGDVTGKLYQTTLGDILGGVITSSSFNPFSSSIDSRVTTNYNLFGKFETTASYQTDSSSFNNQIANVYASESKYTLSSSFLSFSSSYNTDSASFDFRINNITVSGYTTTASFQAFTGSYLVTSASIAVQLVNLALSGSHYTLTSSFNPFSSSYHSDSGSFVTQLANVYASQSLYTDNTLEFIIGDGGTYTPLSGSTQFNPGSNPLAGKKVLEFAQEGMILSSKPRSNGAASYSYTGSSGIINLVNASFSDDAFYFIRYQ